MRHRNAISTSYFHGPRRHIHSPYQQNYTFTRISPTRRYVDVLKYILANPNCKRFDILVNVFNVPNYPVNRYAKRGHMSNLFSNMLYHDLIDYNDKFEYCVTENGRKLLRAAGITEIQTITKVTV